MPPQVRDWIERVTGRPALGWGRLPGASSSAVHAVRLSDDRVALLRRWVAQRALDQRWRSAS